MRLLLDTHALLWVFTDPRQIPPHVRTLIADVRNSVSYSAVTILEIAMGRAAGRRGAPKLNAEDANKLARGAGYELVSITDAHAAAVETIAPHHPDPFDKLLLAQAQIEGLQLVTHDATLAQYDSRTILF